ncbi:O-methyltransferase [Salinibaculum rarum]|uniref:O-methyltransferase n=1 Tax=Salinibaculum rarum TaxID=3058903 RepID=UPI00265E700F|nr:O-methyltransferase [Salinibaculum sp. KK48]
MSDELLSETAGAIAGAIGPERDEILREMDERAEREKFPTVGPDVGGWLSLLARAVEAERIFEFGSGFGYSAYWFARALDTDGNVVLTETDARNLNDAREYFERGGLADRATFEHGDAIEVVDRYEGPFDVVLLDNEKDRYVEAFDAVRGKLREGSLVLADNAVTAGSIDADDVQGLLAGDSRPAATAASSGIAEYLSQVRAAEAFETSLLPLGEGVAVSVRL